MEILKIMWPAGIPRVLWMHRKCPLCSSIEFTVAETHPLDPFLKLFALSAVRCVNCYRRYYWFAKQAP